MRYLMNLVLVSLLLNICIPSVFHLSSLSLPIYLAHYFYQVCSRKYFYRNWYLIQVDMDSTAKVNADYIANRKYWCIFLSIHLVDKTCNEFRRWWLDWYRYVCCKSTNEIVYGDHILICPSNNPCSTNFIQRFTLLPLYGNNTVFVFAKRLQWSYGIK